MNTVELTFHSGPQQGQKLTFRINASIGREPTNTIVLDDPSVSSRHCKIINDGGNTVLKDLHSTNGTFVNGEPIGQIELHSGDMIVIGETRIEVQLTSATTFNPEPEPKPIPSAPTDVSRHSFSTEPQAPEVVVKVEAAPSPLSISRGEATGASLPLPDIKTNHRPTAGDILVEAAPSPVCPPARSAPAKAGVGRPLSDLSPKDSPLVIGNGGPTAPRAGTPVIESVAVPIPGDRDDGPSSSTKNKPEVFAPVIVIDSPQTPEDAHAEREASPAKRMENPETQESGENEQDQIPPHTILKQLREWTNLKFSDGISLFSRTAPIKRGPPSRCLRFAWKSGGTRSVASVMSFSAKSKLKIFVLSICGLALLFGIGFGLQYFLHSNPKKTVSETKPAKPANKPKPKPDPTWKELAGVFKPEGDKDRQAEQRIALLKKLIRRFPKDQSNILSAYLDIAQQYELLKDPQQAIGYYEEFLGKAGRDDKRRSSCMAALIRDLLAGGRAGPALAVFERFCEEKPAEAAVEAERISAATRAEGQKERTAELAAAFQERLLRYSGKNAREQIEALSRDERWARTALWMDEVKERIPWDSSDEQTMLIGILGGMRSVDCFVKTMLTNERLVGEGCDISGRFEDHSYIIACQYPCKADQLLNWYGKTGFEEYRATAAGFIRKMHKLYTSTKDGSSRNWLPIGQFVDASGKAFDYVNAPKLKRDYDIFPWDQSRSSHNTHYLYMDAWGLGMWELAKSAALLEPADRQLLAELLKGQLDFFHRPYMLKNEGDVYYWRTDAFCPLAPPATIPAPNWEVLGLDVIHAVLALHELDEDTKPWRESMRKFAAYYMRERPNNNDRDKLVEYTDLRAMDLADYLEKVCGDKTLRRWLQKNIPTLYEKRKQEVDVAINGGTLVYSPLPVMEILARYDPGQYRRMLRRLMLDHVTPYGLYRDGEYPTINESEHEAILDSALGAWRQGVLSSAEFRNAAEKLFLMWGNPRCYRDVEDWALESYPYQRRRRAWEATPYAGYPENVRPEAYYKGLPHAYTLSFIYGGRSDGTFEHENFNCLVQYTSPGGQHTERLRYGRMATFNILDTRRQTEAGIADKDGLKVMEVECVMPDAPEGTPCVGIVKVTDQYYRNESWREPTGYHVREILQAGHRIPFKVYGMFGYMEPPAEKYGNKDNVKAGFLIRASKPGQKQKVRIVFEDATARQDV